MTLLLNRRVFKKMRNQMRADNLAHSPAKKRTGRFEPNVISRLSDISLLQRRLRLSHVLLLVGSPVTDSFEELQAVAEECGVGDRVIFAGMLEAMEQVISAYRGADRNRHTDTL
jgi:hypothetical protein